MYPDLSYLLHALIGTARDNGSSIVKTFGLFLLLAFIVAARLLQWELERRERIGQLRPVRSLQVPGDTVTTADYIFNAILGFLLGYKLPYAFANFAAWQRDPGGVLLSTDGYWWTGLLGAALLFGYYYNIGRRQTATEPVEMDVYPSQRVGPITMRAAIGGLLGAKLFAVIEYWDRFLENPLQELLSGGGLAIYGGLIGGGVAVYLYLHKHKIAVLPTMDAVAPALIVAYGVGRIGCQLSGDGDWGVAIPNGIPERWWLPDWMYGFDYPHNVLQRGEQIAGCTVEYCSRLTELHYPTPFYETVMAFAIGAVLWGLRKSLTVYPGLLFALYLFLNGVERFFIEYVRINDQYEVLGVLLTQAQLIAIGFMVAGAVMAAWTWRRGQHANA